MRRTDIFTHAAQISRGQQGLCVAQALQASQAPQAPQAPFACPEPSPLARDVVGAHVRPDDLQGRFSALRYWDLQDSIEGVRGAVLATAGEHSGAIGLREVTESDFPLHVSCGPNSSD